MTEKTSVSDQGDKALVNLNSAASAAESCVSVPVTGVHPYGSLQIHHPRPGHESGSGTRADQKSSDGLPYLSPQDLLGDGDVFLLLDLPRGFTVGCDTDAITIETERPVLGFRGLPPGAHLIWVSDPQQMSRCGYWCVTGKYGAGMVRLKQWDRYNEVLGEPASRFEARSHRDNIASLYSKLLPYKMRQDGHGRPPLPPPKDQSRRNSNLHRDLAVDEAVIWHHLTSSISEDLLRRVTGCPLPDTHEWLVDTADTAKGDINFAQASKLFKAVLGSELTFLFPHEDSGLDLDRLIHKSHSSKPGADGDNQKKSQDTTELITSVIDHREGISESDVNGELQFAFLTAVHLGNPSCLDYWLHFVLRVLLRAHRLAVDRPALVRSLTTTLHAQFVYSDRYISSSSSSAPTAAVAAATCTNAGDENSRGILDTLPESSRNRLREALTLYKQRLNESLLGLGDAITQTQVAVGGAFADLEAWCWKYGWDLRGAYVPSQADEDDGQMQSTRQRPGLEADDNIDSDDEDYLPVVVELDGEGREVGLVSWKS